jgi:hypothetical protein
MRSAATLTLPTAVGVLLLMAGPASALSGQCFWNQLQALTRGALVQGYQRLGPQVLDRVQISDGELAAIDSNCGPGPDALKERLLSAVVLEHGSAVFLKGWMHWDDQGIQQAWGRIDPDQSQILRGQAEALVAGAQQPEQSLSRAIGEFLGHDPERDEPGVADQVRGYLTSRAIREAIERRS